MNLPFGRPRNQLRPFIAPVNTGFMHSKWYRLVLTPIISGIFFALGHFLVSWLFKRDLVQQSVKSFYELFL